MYCINNLPRVAHLTLGDIIDEQQVLVYKIRDLMSWKILKMLYFAFIDSYLLHGVLRSMAILVVLISLN